MKFLKAENNFKQDLNSDGTISKGKTHTTTESNGSVSLLKDSNLNAYIQVAGSDPVAIKDVGGRQVGDRTYGSSWQVIAAETVNGSNQLVWKNVNGEYHLWKMDSNWKNVSGEVLKGNEFLKAENNFKQDLNSDGTISKGKTHTTTESQGSVSLLKDSNLNAYIQVAGSDPVAVKDVGGRQVGDRTYGSSWKVIAAETVNGSNQLVWKNVNGEYHLWKMDSDWKNVSGEVLKGNEFLKAENNFKQDLNSDGTISKGKTHTTTESNGSVSLLKDSNLNAYIQVAGSDPVAIKDGGGRQVGDRTYGSSWKVIAAETVNGSNQ